MQWQDDAILLGVRPYGENSAIVSLLTYNHGRHKGLVKGAYGKKLRGSMQLGNKLHVIWRSRLEENLGFYSIELINSNAAALMLDAGKLNALISACNIIDATLPERQINSNIYTNFSSLMLALDHQSWPEIYVKWEISLLAELGFGLNLGSCVVTGMVDDLIYVSPKSACAVSKDAGFPYADKLLLLPKFLLSKSNNNEITSIDIINGLRLSGYFLNRYLFNANDKVMPDARIRLISWINKYML